MSRKAEITLRARNIPIKEKILRKLSWYDSRTHTMYEDEGGDIAFKYDPKTKRTTPYVIDVFADKKNNTFEYIEKFVDNLKFEYGVISKIAGIEVSFEINEEKLKDDYDDILYELEQGLFGNKFCEYYINEDN
jgi:hypothetical protein